MKKIFCIAAGVMLSVGLAAAYTPVYAKPAVVPQMIFDVDFNESSVTPNIGAATEGTNKGTYVESYDGTMAYQFNTSYFKPTAEDGTPLLTGLDEFTVSYWAKIEGTGIGWTFFAAPDASTQRNQYEKYIGILDNGTALASERYNNSGSRPGRIDVSNLPDDWKHVVLVLKEDKSEVYINGELAASKSSSYSVSGILGDNSVIQAGKGNWGRGEYATGAIDNYQIFNYALDAEEIENLYNGKYETPPAPNPAVEWETAVDSTKTGKGDAATGTLRFLASVTDDNGYDVSKGEYGFVFVNFETGIVTKDYMGETDIDNLTGEGVKSSAVSIGQDGLLKNTAYFMDIEDIPLSVTKIGMYAVPYVTLEDGFVIYGTPFTAERFNWAVE